VKSAVFLNSLLLMTAVLVTWCGWCAFCEVGTEYETLVHVSRASVEDVRCHKKLLVCDRLCQCACVLLCVPGGKASRRCCDLPCRQCCALQCGVFI
jgi:hypothetical protein